MTNHVVHPADSLETRITALTELFSQLLDCLEEERGALRTRSLTALHAATEAKSLACAGIESALTGLGAPLVELIEKVDAASRTRLDALHRQLRELAREAKDSNAVNGRIIHRSQQSVRDLINILGDNHQDELYGEHGVFRSSLSGRSSAIAQA
jgi:flagellar biosynthesis/type III secretory pathway chaperone